ncbi:MAG: isoprenylcysteine carboxylmethyltransferase family protein [Pseudomonadota bacterium]
MKWLDIPPIWLLVCLVAAWFSPWVLPFQPLFWLGLFSLILAGVLTLAALIEFRRRRTTPIPHMPPSALITGGVFRISRNPIYLADMLILFGFALIWGKLLGIVLLPVLFVILDRRFIRVEEAQLRTAFPEGFEAYKHQTRRWV